MSERTRRKPAAVIRPVILVLVLGTIGFLVWKNVTKHEDYVGGDIVTTGTIQAVHVQLGFRVAGTLAGVPVSEGQVVQAGQVVARIEDQDLRVRLQAARAALEVAKASVVEARAGRQKAARDLERTKPLIATGAAPQQQLDTVKAAYEVADAQVSAAEAQVHQAESTVAESELQLSYAVLRCPEGGQVSEIIHRTGEMVTIGAPVVAVAEFDTVKVQAAVDETRIGAVRPGDPVRVKVYTFDQRTFPGLVTDIRPAGDFATRKDWGARRRDIRTFTVTARVPNGERLLKDGMTAEVTIHVDPSVQKLAGARP